MLDFPVLAPSLLSADFSNLAEDIKKIEDSGASLVHIDVMDGIFVPQISFGQPVVSSIRKCTKFQFDFQDAQSLNEHQKVTLYIF